MSLALMLTLVVLFAGSATWKVVQRRNTQICLALVAQHTPQQLTPSLYRRETLGKKYCSEGFSRES